MITYNYRIYLNNRSTSIFQNNIPSSFTKFFPFQNNNYNYYKVTRQFSTAKNHKKCQDLLPEVVEPFRFNLAFATITSIFKIIENLLSTLVRTCHRVAEARRSSLLSKKQLSFLSYRRDIRLLVTQRPDGSTKRKQTSWNYHNLTFTFQGLKNL